MATRSLTAIGMVAALLMAATPAMAQKKGKGKKKAKGAKAEKAAPEEVDPSTIDDPKEKAKAYYKRGKVRHEEGDFQGALEDFLGAYNAMPNPGVYISISSCHEKLENYQEAVNYLEKYIEEKPNAGNIVTIKEKLEELKATPGKVQITSTPPGAVLTINGETTEMVTPAQLELPGGDHAMALNLEGYIMETRAFTVPIGGEVTVDVELTSTEAKAGEALPLPTEPVDLDFDEDEEPKKAAKVGPEVWAMAGVAGAGLVSATVFGLLALSEQSKFDKDGQTDQDVADKGKAFAVVCDVSWGLAAAAAITGTVLYIVGAKKAKEKPAESAERKAIKSATIYPVLAPDAAGAGVSMSF
jgi:tetratricopeptide (TPR) repeat protein